MDYDPQHDPELERLLIAQAEADAPDRLAVARAARGAKRAMHRWHQSAAVAGRIGAGPAESDDSSRVWRMARWPLAAAAVIVAGLVGITQWQVNHRSVNGPTIATAPEASTPAMGSERRGRNETSDSFGDWPFPRQVQTPDEESADADAIERMAELFVRPSIAFDAGEADAWSSQLSSLEQLANLDDDPVFDDVMSDWSAFDAGS